MRIRKVIRVLEYQGPEDWLKETLEKSIGAARLGVAGITELSCVDVTGWPFASMRVKTRRNELWWEDEKGEKEDETPS